MVSLGACCFACVYRGRPLQHLFTFDRRCSSAISHICSRSVLIISKQGGRGGGVGCGNQCGAMNDSPTAHLIFSVIKVLLSLLPSQFMWTSQGTVIHRTIKHNLRSYCFLSHELTNCPHVLESFKILPINNLHFEVGVLSPRLLLQSKQTPRINTCRGQ